MLTVLQSFLDEIRTGVWYALLGLLLITVPLLVFHYRRYGQVNRARAIGIYLLVFYGLVLIALTLLPFPASNQFPCLGWNLRPLASLARVHSDLARGHSWLSSPSLFQWVYNVLMFVPLGLILRRSFHRPLWRILSAAIVISGVIELTQGTGVFGTYRCAYRMLDVDDLLANVSGAFLGALSAPLALLLPKPGVPGPVRDGAAGPVRRGVSGLLDLAFTIVLAQAGAIPLIMALGIVFLLLPACTGGSTPGQHLVRARLVRTHDYGPPGLGRLSLRALLVAAPIAGAWLAWGTGTRRLEDATSLIWLAPALVLACTGLAVLATIALRRDKRAPQDLLTGTAVRVVPPRRHTEDAATP
jgi:glycopeptide antibiotics resistance protein